MLGLGKILDADFGQLLPQAIDDRAVVGIRYNQKFCSGIEAGSERLEEVKSGLDRAKMKIALRVMGV